MFRRKVYGESKLPSCPFCAKTALVKNSQGVPVCDSHRLVMVDNLVCACGRSLDLRVSKWGPYGVCESCGNISWTKVCELNRFENKPKPAEGGQIRMTSKGVGAWSIDNPSQPPSQNLKISDQIRVMRFSKADLPKGKTRPNPKEITIRSDEVDLL